jgi:hypothetical protein
VIPSILLLLVVVCRPDPNVHVKTVL